MSILLKPDDAGRTLSEEEISNQVVTLFLAGVETIASASGWALCVLALRPEIQQRLHHEIDTVLQGKLVEMEDLPKLPYTKGVILESLRMYPPGWLLTRMTTADVRLGDFDIPANTAIIYSPFLLGNQSGAFDEPDAFEPDRWGTQTLRLNAGSFVPFGDGPRKCIGDTFSMVEMAVMLTAIIARWRIEPRGTVLRPLERMSLLLTPRGLKVSLSARQPATEK